MAKTQKNTLSTPKLLLQQSLFWLSVILFVFMPFLNNFVIQTVIISIDGNIAYQNLSPVLMTARDMISVFATYAGVGVLACSVAYFGIKNAKGAAILAILHHPISFLFAMGAYIFSGSRAYYEALFMLGTDTLINTALYAVILVVLLFVRSRKQRSESGVTAPLGDKLIGKGGMFSYLFASVGVFAAANLAAMLFSMISAFVDPSIGPPINAQEWVYWITEYASLAIYAAIGYFISVAICYLCEYYLKHFAKPATNASKP